MDDGLTSTTLGGSTFTLASKYRPQRLVGSGSGGVVVAATCADSSNEVAIKKIHIERDLTIERHALAARRTLREISLISQLDHENVLGLLDLSCSGGGAADFDHLYLVTPLMDADLHRVIRSPQPLTEQHVQFFMWQLLRGLEHLHACAVVHRDLKPANLLVNANCDLKITDFGLARVIGGPEEEAPRDGLTSYVVTRWYRAPEVLVGAEYGRAVDVWSAGCILAEMLGRKPLFPGRDALEQLRLILRVAATLPGGSAERDHVPAAARVSLDRLAAECSAAPLDALYPRASADALQMLGSLLAWDPARRPAAAAALALPFLDGYHDATTRPTAPRPIRLPEPATADDVRFLLLREVRRRADAPAVTAAAAAPPAAVAVVADAEDEAKRRATDFAEQLAAYVDREQHTAPPPRAAEGVRDDPKPSSFFGALVRPLRQHGVAA